MKVTNPDIWVLLASGPSLTQEDVNYCLGKAHIAAVNNAAFTCLHFLEIFHAADHNWWDCPRYHKRIFTEARQAELWTCSKTIEKRYKQYGVKSANILPGTRRVPSWGFSKDVGFIYQNKYSGSQLPQIVSWKRPKLMVLLGYDMQYGPNGERHFHPDHPSAWNNVPNLDKDPIYMQAFDTMARQCQIKMVNCTRSTAIKTVERAKLEDVI